MPVGRGFATPMDQATAGRRARQLAALADPERLRVLSALTTRADGAADVSRLADALGTSQQEIAAHVDVLLELGLVVRQTAEIPTRQSGAAFQDRFAPTADAWIRFGRLVATPHGRDPADVPDKSDDPSGETLPPVLQRITDRLVYRFRSTFSRETVERYVADSYRRLAARARVTQHLPVLAARFAEERLGALAVASGRDLRGTPEVLFVCVSNAGRSQMAAAILRQVAGDRVYIRTAGSRPARQLDPGVIEALDEIGVPIVAEFPKPLTDEVVQAADFVITMGCGDACPVYSGRRYMDWPVDDPVGRPIEEVRQIRDDIAARIDRLCQELDIETGTTSDLTSNRSASPTS